MDSYYSNRAFPVAEVVKTLGMVGETVAAETLDEFRYEGAPSPSGKAKTVQQ